MQDLAIDSRQDSESGFVDLQQRQKLPARDDLTQYPGEEVSFGSNETSIVSRKIDNRIQETKPESDVGSSNSDDRREVLEEIRQQLDALTKSVEAGLQTDVGTVPDIRYPALDEQNSEISNERRLTVEIPELLESRRPVNEVGALSTGVEAVPSSNRVQSLTRTNQGDVRNTKLGQHELGIRHEPAIENFGNLESFSQARFNQHVSAAEDHLKAGRYYRAVDSFTLAAIYQPNNPVVLAGKGHALFAAGEYMSSALFLARALAVKPEYTQTKVDLAAMLGGSDKLAERIADVEQWLARSGLAQLQFLLSYVYFHAGRLNQAKQTIATVYEKMPDSSAVVALRTAIDQATK
jgi:hypothetical protein